MMEGIRRFGRGSMRGGDRWDIDQELEPESEADFEFPGEKKVLVSQAKLLPRFTSSHSSGVEYQRNLVLTALDQGGKFGSHRISLPWLRMILAGLEGRNISPEAVWEGVEMPDPVQPRGQSTSYYDLFPVEGES
jgi:hypothetical protein